MLTTSNRSYLFGLEKGEPGVVIQDFASGERVTHGAVLNLTLEAQELLKAPLNSHYDPRWHLAPSLTYSSDACPTSLTVRALAKRILNKRCAFYSGAGLSCAAKIPVISVLNSQLKEKNIEDPFTLQICRNFFHTLDQAQATPAHQALQRLILQHNFPLYTENLDTLHETTELTPIHFEHHKKIPPSLSESFKKCDVIICLGLSRDWRGVLSLARQTNPQLEIVAIDLQQPNYLSSRDSWLQGDLQELLPAIEKMVNGHVPALRY